MLQITIPKPCHEDWNNMLPKEQGKFCNACAKTVVDFTLMTDDEVKNYFIANREQKVCGRFTDNQLTRITIYLPENIFITPMPIWKKFMTAALIVFSTTLFSCNTNYDTTTGMIVASSDTHIIGDTTEPIKNNYPPLLGKVVGRDTTPVKKECTPTMGIIAPPRVELKGDVLLIDTVKHQIDPPKQTNNSIVGTATVVNPQNVKGKVQVPPTEKICMTSIDSVPVQPERKLLGDIVILPKKNQMKNDSCENKTYE